MNSSLVTRHSSLERANALRGFTLLELIIVVGIMIFLTVLSIPAFTSRKPAEDLTNAANTITSMMEQARTLAISKNTYTWLGFYEEDATDSGPTTSTPPYPGKGRLVMAIVYSKDGTGIYEIGLSQYQSGSWPLNQPSGGKEPSATDPIAMSGTIVKIENVHIGDIGSPTPSPVPSPSPDSLDARSGEPYSSPIPADSHFNRISSDSADATRFQFTARGYTFYKTIRFSPRGEARLNTYYDFRRMCELGLIPTRGKVIPNPTPANVIAIQFSAFGGHFKIYRR